MTSRLFPPDWNAPEEEWRSALEALQEKTRQKIVAGGDHLLCGGKTPRAMPGAVNTAGCHQPIIQAVTPFNKAFFPGHVYSEAGAQEIGISGVCEWCYDKMFAEPEDRYPELDDPKYQTTKEGT